MTYELEQKLNEAVRLDCFYQELLRECKSLEPEYLRIKSSLPDTEQEILERYISACEELEYRRMCVALSLENRT